jgi:hypothetical protein
MGIAGKQAYTVRTKNTISERQCFAARFLNCYVGKDFFLYLLSFCLQARDVGETQSFVPNTAVNATPLIAKYLD